MRPPVTIRPFRLSDMERVLAIEQASFGEDAYDRKLFAGFLRTCGGLFLVALRGKRLLGYMVTCVGARQAAVHAELISVAVDPPARGQGAASLLMRSTLRRLRLRQVRRFTLVVRASNDTARVFYERYGFTKVRRLPGYYDTEDGVSMRKLL